MFDLRGKSVVITGSSRGIGAGIAKMAAHHGARVAVTYASQSRAAEELLRELPGEGHLCLPLDVTDEGSVIKAVDSVLKSWDKVDGWVNNAGITRDQILLRMKDEDFDAVLATNLRGVFLCTRAVLRPMLKARQGAIVNVTSVIGQMGNAGQSNYAASKGGVEAFTKSIAQEVGSRSIRLNCVAPGFISTDMTAALTEEQREKILTQVPLQTLGRVEDVAAAVCFLLSEGAAYITGQTLSVNGGLYM